MAAAELSDSGEPPARIVNPSRRQWGWQRPDASRWSLVRLCFRRLGDHPEASAAVSHSVRMTTARRTVSCRCASMHHMYIVTPRGLAALLLAPDR